MRPDWFPVTDKHIDAPDGARVHIEEYDADYERHGEEWVLVDG